MVRVEESNHLIKFVELGLTYIMLYTCFDTIRTSYANMNCHPYFYGKKIPEFFPGIFDTF